MNFRTTIILIVLLAVVGIYLLFTRTSGDTEVKQAGDSQALMTLKSDDVSRISIAPAGEAKVVIEKAAEGKWRIVEPVQAAADRYEVDSLVSGVASLSSRGKVSLIDAGVESPRYIVEISGKAGESHTLAIGQRSAVGDHMYVRLDDAGQADVVSADLYDSLQEPLKKYRETRLFDVSSTDIRQIRISGDGTNLKLDKSGTEWQLPDQNLQADSSAASDITFALTGLNASEFVNDASKSPADFGLDQPVLSVWFSTELPTTQPSAAPASRPAGTTIRFGRYVDIRKKDVYVGIDGTSTIATIPASSLDSFRKSPLDLRSKDVLDIDTQSVRSITIESDIPAATQPTSRDAVNRTITIQRQPEQIVVGPQMTATTSTTQEAATQEAPAQPKWFFTVAGDGKVDEGKVDDLLGAMHPLKAEKFMDQAPATQPAATFVLKITAAEAGRTWELHITDPGDDRPLIGAYDQWRFEIARSLLDKLDGDFTATESTSP